MSTPIPKSTSYTGPVPTNPASIGSTPGGATAPTPPSQPKKAQEDPTAAAKASQGSKQNATEQMGQQQVQGQVAQKTLQKQTQSSAAPAGAATELKQGEQLNAKFYKNADGFNFLFDRRLTQEQVTQIIFQKGIVPPEAKIVKGPGNWWTVQIERDAETRAKVATHMNSHTEHVLYPPRQPNDVAYPDPQITYTFTVGLGAVKATPQRRDLKNDMGFVIVKKYKLDEGQSPANNVKSLVRPGPGYEIKFEKPVTKDEVMEKFFNKEKLRDGQVRLIPVPYEPTTNWQVHFLDAEVTLKRGPDGAFNDASVYTDFSIPPTVPSRIKAHLDNKTVPADAKKLAPNVYVWEQEGHIIRVEANGKKGKDAYYQYEVTKLTQTDKPGDDTMRYYMMEKGLPARKAWQEYIKHWDEIHVGMLGMVAGAARKPHIPGPAPKVGVSPRARVSGEAVGTPKAPTKTIVQSPPPPPAKPNGPASKTIVSQPPPMPKPKPAPKVTASEVPAAPKVANPKVLEADVIATYRKDPSSITHTMSSNAHEEVWKNLGNTGPAPVAYRVGDKIRVDVQRFDKSKLHEIGIKPRSEPLKADKKVVGGSKAKASEIEMDKTGAPPKPNSQELAKTPAAAPPPPAPAPAAKAGNKTGGSTAVSQPNVKVQGPQGMEVSLQRVQQMAAAGSQVRQSVSSATHKEAWNALRAQKGLDPSEPPVAFIVDKMVFVDMARWPKDMPLPAGLKRP